MLIEISTLQLVFLAVVDGGFLYGKRLGVRFRFPSLDCRRIFDSPNRLRLRVFVRVVGIRHFVAKRQIAAYLVGGKKVPCPMVLVHVQFKLCIFVEISVKGNGAILRQIHRRVFHLPVNTEQVAVLYGLGRQIPLWQIPSNHLRYVHVRENRRRNGYRNLFIRLVDDACFHTNGRLAVRDKNLGYDIQVFVLRLVNRFFRRPVYRKNRRFAVITQFRRVKVANRHTPVQRIGLHPYLPLALRFPKLSFANENTRRRGVLNLYRPVLIHI